MKTLKVILAEDHHIVRDGIKMLLDQTDNIDVVGEAINGRQVLDMLDSGIKADVILADINMPEMDGISLIKEITRRKLNSNVVILSMLDNYKYVTEAFAEGALGYLLKNVGVDELVFAIRQASKGQKYLCAELSFQYMNTAIQQSETTSAKIGYTIDLSSREMEVLSLIAEGLTNNEISDQLFISRRTVEGHRQALIEKTGVKNTAVLIRYAYQNGILK
ncbi:response regulator [Pedobacter antarcticus]|uniref:response regulator n=1 Tax=Pedobacter antarcticus TaxID=34086 RepID=UPI001C5A0014|nr:response regulator transcription factor [Pedobacter antarcticus]